MRRPALTDASFLAHIFSPKKNPQPTGLRHRILKGSKGQRKARINAYNKMPASKQAVIDRSGNRDKFLRGEVTYTDSKKALRESGVRQGILKPLRIRRPKISPGQQIYDDAVVEHFKDVGLDQAERWDERHVRNRLATTQKTLKRQMLSSDRATIRRNAKRRSDEFADEYDYNPWWYH
jgi:hypothetical protein